jgi:UPF0716 protein FxsA
MGWILLLFTAVPILEMYLLISVGGYLGALPTIALVMLTAVVGVALLRWQGTSMLTRGMARMSSGTLPAQEIAEGMMLGISGALLLTPGFITDAFGFFLLFPPARLLILRLLKRRLKVVGMPPESPRQPGSPGETIEGEFERR